MSLASRVRRSSVPQGWAAALAVTCILVGSTLVGRVLAPSPARAEEARTPAPRTSTDTGRELYARYCQLCHAPDATGYAADEAPSLVSPTFLESASDAYIARGIRFGRPNTAMAAYGKARGGPLDDVQIAAIVRFLRSKGPAARPLAKQAASGDAARGGVL